MRKLVKRAGLDKIEAVPDRVIVLKNAGASAQAADDANFRIKYAEVLNAAQLAAVTHRDGPLLVVAGAGSGKTRTLIYRVAGGSATEANRRCLESDCLGEGQTLGCPSRRFISSRRHRFFTRCDHPPFGLSYCLTHWPEIGMKSRPVKPVSPVADVR